MDNNELQEQPKSETLELTEAIEAAKGAGEIAVFVPIAIAALQAYEKKSEQEHLQKIEEGKLENERIKSELQGMKDRLESFETLDKRDKILKGIILSLCILSICAISIIKGEINNSATAIISGVVAVSISSEYKHISTLFFSQKNRSEDGTT